MLVSVGLPVDRHGDPRLLSADGIAEVAQAAERAGFGAVFCTDHPAPDEAWLTSGGHPTLDPFVALSFAAAATTTVRVHTNLLVLGYRNPLLTAKSVASLDVLSGGRVIVGVGAGYLDTEFVALGVDPAERGALADDALETMTTAWRGEAFDVDGRGYTARRTIVTPPPVQRPHPPLWVGGNSVAAMRRAVRWGAAWAPMPSPVGSESLLGTPAMPDGDALAVGVRRLRELSDEAGRAEPPTVVAIPPSVSGFGRRAWEAAQVIDEVGILADAGATSLVVNLPGMSVDEFCDQLAAFGDAVVAQLRD